MKIIFTFLILLISFSLKSQILDGWMKLRLGEPISLSENKMSNRTDFKKFKSISDSIFYEKYQIFIILISKSDTLDKIELIMNVNPDKQLFVYNSILDEVEEDYKFIIKKYKCVYCKENRTDFIFSDGSYIRVEMCNFEDYYLVKTIFSR